MISGEKIRRIRMSRGLSQREIAKFCGCDRAYISEIENFKRIPSEELYEKIIKAIYTLDGSGENKRRNKNGEKISGDNTTMVQDEDEA